MRSEIVAGIASIPSLLVGGAPLPPHTAKIWSEIFGGSGLQCIFAATETLVTFWGGSLNTKKVRVSSITRRIPCYKQHIFPVLRIL